MNQQEYLQAFEEITKMMYEVTKAKNNDYSGANAVNAFANFEAVEGFGIKTEHGFLTRMIDKIKRVSNLIESEPQVKDEKVVDTLLDLANYSILFLLYLKQK